AFAQVGQILASYSLGRCVTRNFVAAAVVREDLQVHFGLAAHLLDIADKLALVGSDRLTKSFVVVEYGSKPEGQNGGVLEAVRNHPGVIHTGFLIQGFQGIVFADYDGEVTCWIKKYLVSTYSQYRFQRYWLTMTG